MDFADAGYFLGEARHRRAAPNPMRRPSAADGGKRLLVRFGGRIRQLMPRMLQFGVVMPGGCEALIHARATVEHMAQQGQLGAIAIVDVDLVNCFGMFEWPATLAAVDELLPEISPWVRLCTAQPDQVRLPCGAWVERDRGTGQGEPEGPLKAAITNGRAGACRPRPARMRRAWRVVVAHRRWADISAPQAAKHDPQGAGCAAA